MEGRSHGKAPGLDVRSPRSALILRVTGRRPSPDQRRRCASSHSRLVQQARVASLLCRVVLEDGVVRPLCRGRMDRTCALRSRKCGSLGALGPESAGAWSRAPPTRQSRALRRREEGDFEGVGIGPDSYLDFAAAFRECLVLLNGTLRGRGGGICVVSLSDCAPISHILSCCIRAAFVSVLLDACRGVRIRTHHRGLARGIAEGKFAELQAMTLVEPDTRPSPSPPILSAAAPRESAQSGVFASPIETSSWLIDPTTS